MITWIFLSSYWFVVIEITYSMYFINMRIKIQEKEEVIHDLEKATRIVFYLDY